MAFDETPRFPEDISKGATGGPMFSTVVVVAGSGAEQRVGQWSTGRRRWDVAHSLKTPAQGDALLAFFLARQGRLRGFRFKDWTDYRVSTAEELVEITATTFQLVKRYTSGVVNLRTITKPVQDTVRLWDGASEVTTGWDLDPATGIVTFLSDPAYDPAWTGEFDTPVRFDTDEMKLTQEDVGIRSWDAIPLVEVRI